MFEQPIGQSVAALRAAITDVGEMSTLTMSPAELHGLAEELIGARSALDAVVCSVTAAADRAGVQTITGHRTAPASIGTACGIDPAVVASDRNLGRWVDDYPRFRDAFAAGVLSRRHIQVLSNADNPRTTAALTDAQDYLIAAARDCTWRQFKQAVRYWELAADPDGTEPRIQAEKRRGSILTLADGTVKQTTYHPPVVGAAVKNAVETRAKQYWTEDQRRAEHDPDYTPRTHAQRIADASAQLQIDGHHATAPVGAPPLIHIVMSQTVAEDALARLHQPDNDHPDRLPLDSDTVDGRCELIDGTPIHPAAAISLLARATLRRLVIGADSEILDLGRAVRGFPRRLHQALLAVGRGSCAIPGCDAPVAWLEADHIHPWSKGGTTATTNGQILCAAHNKAKSDRVKNETAKNDAASCNQTRADQIPRKPPDPPQLE